MMFPEHFYNNQRVHNSLCGFKNLRDITFRDHFVYIQENLHTILGLGYTGYKMVFHFIYVMAICFCSMGLRE